MTGMANRTAALRAFSCNLSVTQCEVVAAVTAALNAGWTPRALAAITGANTSGVRNPYAVLAVRLSAAE